MNALLPRPVQPIGRHLSFMVLCVALVMPGVASAATSGTEDNADIDDLRRTVNALLQRVDSLERELARRPPAPSHAKTARQATAPTAAPRRRPASDSSGAAASQTAAPGLVEIDELAAERALERTLTAEGALLLAPKQFDLEPYFNYARRESRLPALVASADALGVRTLSVRRNEFDLGLRFRAGLPFAAQFELDMPYRWVDQSSVAPAGFNDVDVQDNQGSSLGDIKLGIAKTLLRQSGWLPDLVGRVTWDTGTGDQEDAGVPLGIGFDELRFGLTALKRQDPLAFTAALSYTTTFEKDGIKPGDDFGFLLGVSLATSPETSLSVAFEQRYSQELAINGRRVAGSDQVSSFLALGASSILGRRTLLSVSLGIGLTEDSPDYSLSVSLPLRF